MTYQYQHSIERKYAFEAGHYLPSHKGQCSRPHGHSYKVKVQIVAEGPEELHLPGSEDPSSEGMLIDFKDLDEVIKPIIDLMDHHTLSNHLAREARYRDWPSHEMYFISGATTAENLARHLCHAFDAALKGLRHSTQPRCRMVTVSETERNDATYINPLYV